MRTPLRYLRKGPVFFMRSGDLCISAIITCILILRGKIFFRQGLNKCVGYTKYLYLLDKILVYHNVGVVVHLSSVHGSATDVVEILASENEVDYSRRQRDQDHNDGNNWELCRKNAEIEDENEQRAYYREGVREYLYRSHACLTVCVLKLVIEGGKVEGRKVKLLCFFHYLALDVLYHKLARKTRNGVVEVADKTAEYLADKEELLTGWIEAIRKFTESP